MGNDLLEHSQKYPQIIEIYQKRYEKMATLEYRAELINFTKSVLHDPIENLDWKALLDWEHRHLKYTREELPKPRAELPIQIIHQSKGRCGEFALLYNGLLLANGYKSRLVIDCSTLKDKSKKVAGDHVWIEIFINNTWVHVDPTEKRISQPLMYANEWNKDVNQVYALTDKEIVDVTKTYQPM
jgi:transglutaminase-like putative cysteine protease